LPRNFGTFMQNADNKAQLIRFLPKEWQSQEYAQLLLNITIFFVCENERYGLHSVDGSSVTVSVVDCLCSSQEEADTRIILHCRFVAKSMPGDGAIVVRSPDTDVFILVLAYASEIHIRVLFNTGNGRPLLPDACLQSTKSLLSLEKTSLMHCQAFMRLLAVTRPVLLSDEEKEDHLVL